MSIRDGELAGRVALVTGASRGIGRAIATELGRAGARVVVNFTANEAAASETLALIAAAGGPDPLARRWDVADEAATNTAIKEIADGCGALDIVVNNAGIAIDGLLLRLKDEDWQRTLAVNLTGALNVTRAASRYLLKARDKGRIVNITSVVGEQGNGGQTAYAAAKAGLIGITKSLARELASRGITVNAVSPGFIDTDMTAAHVQGDNKEKLLAQIPLGRMGTADEIAHLTAFLCGPRAAYITGQVLRVNGGLLM